MANDAMFRMVGGEQLARVAADMKRQAPMMRKKLPARLRAAVEPVRRAVAAEASRVDPAFGSLVKTRTSMRGQVASVKLVVDPRGLPPLRRPLPMLLEVGSQGAARKYIRHPVFGNEHNWVNQPTQPYFYRTVYGHLPAVQAAVGKLMEDMGKEFRSGSGHGPAQ